MTGIKRRVKGSVTLEASIALPVFICVIVSVAFLVKVVYVHQEIQHAITETANKISSASYIYHISGLSELEGSFAGEMQQRAGVFRKHMDTFFDSYESLAEKMDTVEEVAKNPVEELKNAAAFLAAGQYENIKTEVCIPLMKESVKGHLLKQAEGSIDDRMRQLGIKGGFEGLDFSSSRFFEYGNGNIDIVVKYEMLTPLPIKVMPRIIMVQRASVKAWMGGDETALGNQEDIWSLSNLERGKRVWEIFDANLPWLFPDISGFYSGKAVLIRSIDLTSRSYQSKEAVTEKIMEYARGLSSYRGQEQPWGKERIVIREKDITSRELLLVIPKNPIAPQIKQAVFECAELCAAIGVTLRVEEYGVKKGVN